MDAVRRRPRRLWTLFAAGRGGCAQDRVAFGNVATKDAIFMLQDLNIKTGLDLAAAGRGR